MLRSFWSYELVKRAVTKENQTPNEEAVKVLLCGGLAGVVTWASIFPLGTSPRQLCSLQRFADVLARRDQNPRANLGPRGPSCHHSPRSKPAAAETYTTVSRHSPKTKHLPHHKTSLRNRRPQRLLPRPRYLQRPSLHSQRCTVGGKHINHFHLTSQNQTDSDVEGLRVHNETT